MQRSLRKLQKKCMSHGCPNNLLVVWLDFEEGVDSYAAESQKPPADQKYQSAASVTQVLNTTDVMISGNFTVEETKTFASVLNAGSLPVKLTEIYSTSVGAQFGEDALKDTVFAGVVGVLLIFCIYVTVLPFTRFYFDYYINGIHILSTCRI